MLLRRLILLATSLLVTFTSQAEQVVTIGYQRSSALLLLLKNDGQMEQRLKPLGFTVKWQQLDGSLLNDMSNGTVDLNADITDAFAVLAQANNAPLTFYARETPSPKSQAVIVAQDSPIRTVADLKGKTVAVAKGTGSHFLLISTLQTARLTLDDITPRYVDAAEGERAFNQGEVDAWAIWEPYVAAQQKQHGVRVLANGTSGIASSNRFYTATNRFAAAHPEVLQAVFDVLRQAGQWAKGHPKEAAKNLAPLWGDIPLAAVELANSRRSYDVVPVKIYQLGEQQRIADLYYAQKIIPRPVNIADISVWVPGGD